MDAFGVHVDAALKEFAMKIIKKATACALLAAMLAACAQPVAPSLDAPQPRRVDAKTQLETGGGY
jgi:hypothetical protein